MVSIVFVFLAQKYIVIIIFFLMDFLSDGK